MIGTSTPDVCVVGAGPCGALIAANLATAGHDVVVLEAGERFDLDENNHRQEMALRTDPRTAIWNMGGEREAYTVSGDTGYDLNARRVKGIGGSTLHWGATVPRFHPADFEMQTRHGVYEDWPISYADLEPYYLEAEHEMGAAGSPSPFGGGRSGPFPMDPHPFSHSDHIFDAACDDLGIELHHLPRAINSDGFDDRSACVGYGTCNPVCPSGAKYTAAVHIDRAERAGATILAETPVQRLEHDPPGEHIERAIIKHDGEDRKLEASLFVLAAGAIENPRLLLLSKSQTYSNGLANTSGLVGRRFMEHVAIRAQGRIDAPTRQHLIGFGTSQTQQFYGYDDGPEGSILITPSNTAGASPLGLALETRPNVGAMLGGEIPTEKKWGDAFLDAAQSTMEGALEISAGTQIEGSPDNRIALDESTTDVHGNPVPDIRISVDTRATDILERAEAQIVEILEATGAYDISTVFTPENAFFTNHQTGTTRMGTDPENSVVDPTLQTHDVSNLYITGGSTFVTGGPANPTLTMAAVSLRLAEELNDRLGGIQTNQHASTPR